jgi:hypothetical protein
MSLRLHLEIYSIEYKKLELTVKQFYRFVVVCDRHATVVNFVSAMSTVDRLRIVMNTGNPRSSSSPQEHRIQELRVAHHELLTPSSADSNQVYIQLSPGSVALPTDRSVAEARVSRQLQNACEEQDKLESMSATSNMTK